MMETNVEQFMSSYADAVHTLPSELQMHITTYLQSDLQHQHLLNLCKRYVTELKQTTNEANQKKLLHQLVVSLLAIQDICDRRIATMDEMDHLVEHHTQKLATSRANLNTEPSQSCASGTENTVESEPDADDQTESESRNGATQLHDAVSDDGNLKQSGFDGSDTELLVDSAAASGMKRKMRLPLRNTSQLSRRVLNRWEQGGASHRRTTQSALSGSKKTAIQALRQRCLNEQRTRDRVSGDHRHKLGATYARYASTQQQKQQKQQHHQQQQQRMKNQRVLSRSRPVNLLDSARRRSAPKENKPTPAAYLSTGRRLSAKLSRTPGRSEWPNSEQYYFNDTAADSNTRSASQVSSDDEKDECAAAAAAAILSPHHSSRSMDNAGWSKENEDCMEGSEELDESDYADDDDVNEGASLSMREIKPYCGKDPKSRLSSPSLITGAGTSNRNSKTGVPRRRVSRLRKLAVDPDSNYGAARVSSERNVVVPAQSSPSSSLELSSVQPRGSLNATVYPLNSPITKRRDKAAFNMSRHHAKPEIKHTARSTTDEIVKPLTDTQKPHVVGSSAEHSSDGSGSPDERLYCLCRKISFGDMIACDNKLCKVEWFHFACVDIRVQPKGKWYCPFCRGDSSKVKRSDV